MIWPAAGASLACFTLNVGLLRHLGAVAISTLAGATLVAAAPHSPLLRDLLPFLKGFSLLF